MANLSTIDFDGFYQGFARISSPFRLTYNYRNEIVDLGANSFALLDGDFDADAKSKFKKDISVWNTDLGKSVFEMIVEE